MSSDGTPAAGFLARSSPERLFWIASIPNLVAVLIFALATLCMPLPEGARVYASFWASGQALFDGANPFAAHAMTWIVKIPGPNMVDVNLNPPPLLPLMQLFALAPLAPGAILLVVLSLLAYTAGALHLVRQTGAGKLQAVWIGLLAAATDTLLLGQIYVLLFLLGLGIWSALRSGRQDLASVLIGLLILSKPNFALALPVLFLARHFRLSLTAGAVALAGTILTAEIYGVAIYRDWLLAAARDEHWIFPTTVSIPSYFRRLGLPGLGLAVTGVLLLGTLGHAWRLRPDVRQATVLGLTLSMLCSPLCWFHYVLVLVPFIMEEPWKGGFKAGAVLLAVPVGLPLLALRENLFLQASIGGIYMFALLMLFAAWLRQSARSGSRPGAPGTPIPPRWTVQHA